MQQKFLKISEKIVSVIFSVLVIYMFLASIVSTCVMVYTDEHTYYIKDFPILMCVGLLGFIVAVVLLNKKLTINEKTWKWITCISTILWFGILIWIVSSTKLPMVYDQARVYGGAIEFLKGDYTHWKPFEYFYAYPYINGMVLMECPFVWIFGAEYAYIAMQYINILFWYGTILLLAKMSTIFWNKVIGRFVYFTLLLFIPMWLYVTFVYGTIPGLFFGVLSFYLEKEYEKKQKKWYLFGSLFSMIIAIAWKSNYQIFIIALMIMLFLHGIRNRRWFSLMGGVIALLILCFELSWISSFVHHVTGESVDGNTPTITWIAMGLQESSIAPGWYNAYTENTYAEYNYNQEKISKAAIESIKERCTLFREEPMYGLRFFFRKIASMWNNPSFQSLTIVTKRNVHADLTYFWKDLLYDGGMKNIALRLVMDIMHSMMLFGMVLHVILSRRQQNLMDSIWKITFIGGFLFHLVWEAMGQYALPYYILIIPYAVHGYGIALERIQEIFKGEKTFKASAKLWKEAILKTETGKRFIALTLAILFVSFANFELLSSTIKLQGEEKDYIWYCTHELQWQNNDYHKI